MPTNNNDTTYSSLPFVLISVSSKPFELIMFSELDVKKFICCLNFNAKLRVGMPNSALS